MTVIVVLSAAKDLIAACNRHEILRCAQDDSYFFLAAAFGLARTVAMARTLA
jgi:hypothetical protein